MHLEVAGLSKPLVVSIKEAPPCVGKPWAVRPAPGALHVFGPDGARLEPQAPGAIQLNGFNGLSEVA